ncbi:MAG: LuxR C-terminal-related transcriptional regulator [Candidatus Acidiferrum sp.]
MKRKNLQLQNSIKPKLSRRECEVIALLAKGNPNKIVAGNLGISIRTAEVHRASIMRKLGFRSMSDLMLYAVKKKIVEL